MVDWCRHALHKQSAIIYQPCSKASV
jgi:hypothetical protein